MYEGDREQSDRMGEPGQKGITNWWLAAIVLLLGAILFVQLRPEATNVNEVAAAMTTTSAAAASTDDAADDTEESVDTTTTTTEGTTTTSTTTTVASTTTTAAPSATEDFPLTRAAAEQVVSEWIGFIASEDVDAAWALVASDSRSAFGGRSEFGSAFTDLAESYGVWNDVSDMRTYVSSIGSDGPDFELVVTLAGTVGQEGDLLWSAVAIPVTSDGGEAKVAPFLDADMIIGNLWPGSDDVVPVYAPDAQFGMIFPSDGTFLIVVDGVEVTELRVETEDGGSYPSFGPLSLEVGTHAATGIYLTPEGMIYARAFAFVVSEGS